MLIGYTVLVCGSRHWQDYYAIKGELEKLPKRTLIIHGNCRGADKLADKAAKKLHLKVKRFPANWIEHGNAAGPVRNTEMINERPDKVLAFHEDLPNSTGTKDTVEKARKAGIEVEIFTRRGGWMR